MYKFDIFIILSKDNNKKIGTAKYPTFEEAQKASAAIQKIGRGRHLVKRAYPNTGYRTMEYGGYMTNKIVKCL